MQIDAVEPDVDADALLPGAQFIDAFRVEIHDPTLDARHAAIRMIEHGPRWIDALMALRNLIVAPFGLKTPAPGKSAAGDRIGIFPVVSETSEQIVAGFNDSHLDFRVVVNVGHGATGRSVTTSTLVLTHNRLGRAYLATIMPFHRLVVRSMLRRLAD
ncbi:MULTISPECIES: DUF2867 domain-containing protein [Rhodopseudomonas]|uniref:DUF2867 domain-containing protein n=1 Tax=Rhodopseudomonas palustris TaxID=1076 RepID=A0A0D7EXM0_RHOPL|nr:MULTISPECIES: DUF2867 domain-containing protein [Rhodopseudomonas]KIZ45568.1 hypothetical protein OO17_07625 [Rhodopseudomonas palustris]MDF3814020.1 DUF2867 domain-containing protein [Rhodopseudomonas sp. BAL398]WOK16839.1 DUF2867 domain-containing protein [Rhodopseudomonas sp. BAL398]